MTEIHYMRFQGQAVKEKMLSIWNDLSNISLNLTHVGYTQRHSLCSQQYYSVKLAYLLLYVFKEISQFILFQKCFKQYMCCFKNIVRTLWIFYYYFVINKLKCYIVGKPLLRKYASGTQSLSSHSFAKDQVLR